MYNLLTAIQTQFNASDALSTLFPNGCYLTLAPYGQSLPTCVLTVASAVPAYEMGKHTCTTTFSVTFTVRSLDGDWAISAAEEIKLQFDDADFAISDEYGGGDSLMDCRRVNETTGAEDERVANATVTYQIEIEEQLP